MFTILMPHDPPAPQQPDLTPSRLNHAERKRVTSRRREETDSGQTATRNRDGLSKTTSRPGRDQGSITIAAAVWLACLGLFLAPRIGSGQPAFISEPVGQSVSLGVDLIILYAEAYGAGPVSYQWRKDGENLPGQTMEILIFNSPQASDSGDYDVVASDFTGSVTSQVATILIDPTFRKITAGPVVEAFAYARSGTFGDYDHDGYLDLFVAYDGNVGNRLLHNNRDGTFTRVTNSAPGTDVGFCYGGAWGDANNDGFLDLFVATYGQNLNGQNDFFYLNNGNGGFSRATNGPVVRDGGNTFSGAWADVDNDGWLDLFAVNQLSVSGQSLVSGTNFLYHNNGDGTFTRLNNGPGNDEPGGGFIPPLFTGASFADYDNDGRLDVFLGRDFYQGASQSVNYALYRNSGRSLFTRVLNNPISNDSGNCAGGAWADYDNDGWLDLFVPNGSPSPLFGTVGAQLSFLYHNNGDGTFTKVTNGVLAEHVGQAVGAVWGDYDNDGFVDLFVTDAGANNSLYHNNGDGTFSPITTGSLVSDGGTSYGCAWADYDNDGFLDLFVANYDQGNFLYRNSGNTNAWLKVNCVGRFSNRVGLGAKVRVQATIGGTNRWQLREITGGSTSGSQPLLAHFGLGEASQATRMRVEWPSGAVQEIGPVPARQSLVLQEPDYQVLPTEAGAGLGADFTFSMAGADLQGKLLQWRFNGVDIPGATGPTLVLTGVQTNQLGDYTVVVSDPDGGTSVITPPRTLQAAVKPAFTLQPTPTNLTVSLGVSLTYQSAVTGSDPMLLQWRLNGEDIPGENNASLVLSNVQLAQAGSYLVAARNLGGSATSQVCVLDVDPTFTKVIPGSVVNDGGASIGAGWIEMDGSPFPWLFVANAANQNDFFYRNLGDGTFTRMVPAQTNMIGYDGGASYGVAVGDYDNDGRPDIFVANAGNQNNFLYHNEGGGSFAKITSGRVVNDGGASWGAAWADYDHDGFLDLYVANNGDDFLYHNNRDGTFDRVTNSILARDGGNSRGCAWADYDNDGYPDLFVANSGAKNFLYHNNGDGSFTKITNGVVTADSGGNACAWGDYDNDGNLDLYVARGGGCYLYRNNGDSTFTKITSGSLVTNASQGYAAAWADYDNDGWLDLYVAGVGNDFLYRNNGDGTFASITRGSLVSDGGSSQGCAWGDLDNDGFPDLFVSNNGQNNALYRNNGNSNHWLKVRCQGVGSNRSGIGTKVRLQARIGGQVLSQFREITSGDGLGGQGLVAMFGLGDATEVMTLRLEWPSGQVQVLTGVVPDQYLTLVEPSNQIRLSAARLRDGQFEFELQGPPGSVCGLETSTDLQAWSPWLAVTNESSPQTLRCPAPASVRQMYFRAVGR
jgi:enediyne biosynthesis protein E4